MHPLDFLGRPPNLFLFQKESNKTNFGGFLFLLYILIMIPITLGYILDYSFNNKYVIQSEIIYNQYTPDYIKILNQDPSLNPELEFWFELTNQNNKVLNDSFKIYNTNLQKFIKRNQTINLRPTDVNLGIYLKCNDNCNLDEDDKSYHYNKFWIEFDTQSFDFQNSDPVKNDHRFITIETIPFYSNYLVSNYIDWQIIKCEEELGLSKIFYDLFNIIYKYTFGTIGSIDKILLDKSRLYDILYDEEDNRYRFYRLLGIVKIKNEHSNYLQYKRRKISVLNIIGTVSALSSTILFALSFIFKFYSNNFNSYKILESIIKDTQNEGNKTIEDLNYKINADNSKSILLENINEEKISESNSRSNLIINDNEDSISHLPNQKDFQKIKFIHFF